MSFSWYILCCGNQREYFQRSTHNHSMLPGSSLLARLAGRPRPQLGRLIVKYAASLYEERSESRLATVASSFHHQISERSFRWGLIGSEIIWRGEKQYWKNKDGKPLEVTISSIHSTGFSHDKYYNHYNCSFFPLHSASGLGFGYFLFPNIFLGTYIYSSCFDSMYF